MLIKSKYKIARRLGPAVFEKTQTQKFFARSGSKFEKGGGRGATDFGKALLEKQKARFTYIMNERQFKNYAKVAIAEKTKKPEDSLFQLLETRLDNVVARLGLISTRLGAKQAVSHGHIAVNGKRLNIPSAHLKIGDTVSVMPRSQKSVLFKDVVEKAKEHIVPKWLSFDPAKMEGKVVALPKFIASESSFDIGVILDFYKR
jgi:small subunit ribosomal protein S4